MNERTTDEAEAATRLPEARDRSYTPPHGAQGGAMTGVEAERRAERARTRREPLARADRIQIAMFAGLVTIFAAMLGAGTLGFTAISGQFLDMQKQIGGVQTEIGNLRTEMHKQIGELRTEMHDEIGELSERVGNLEGRMAGLEGRMASLEGRMGNLEERMTRFEDLIQTRLLPQAAVPPSAGS